MSSPVFAQAKLVFDFDTGSGYDGVRDNEATPGPAGTMGVKIYLADWDQGACPADEIFGAKIFFTSDDSSITATCTEASTDHGEPWDPGFSQAKYIGSGDWLIQVGDFSCQTIVDGKILIATLELKCIAAGNTTISAEFQFPTGYYKCCLTPTINKNGGDASATVHTEQYDTDGDGNTPSATTTTVPSARSAEEGEGDGTSATTTTILASTTPTTTLTTAIKTDSNINIINGGNTAPTAVPKTSRAKIHDTGLRTTPGTVSTPVTPDTPARTEQTAKTVESPIESPESISELSSKTTTAPLPSSCTVVITPSWSMIDSGAKLHFSAKTILDGEEVEGTYQWDIVPASTIGSTIDKNGLFTARNNTSGYNNMETVRVTDMIHENNSVTASVIIKAEKHPPDGCELSVSPSSATVLPGETIRYFASNSGKTCVKGSYKWGISSKIGSRINSKGIYTAEKNDTGNSVIDIITAEDATNGIKASALLNVLFEEKAAQSAPGSTQKPQQETPSVRGTYSTAFIISALAIVFLVGVILFWIIKR